MTWFFIALGAPFLWALVNISDKYLVTNYSGHREGDSSSGSLILFSSLIGLLAAAIIGSFLPNVFNISSADRVTLLITGALGALWILLYLFSLEIEEVSSVVPWMLTVPIFGYGLGYLFLGETITTAQLVGMLIVVAGAAILSVDFSKLKYIFKWRVAVYMLLSMLIYSTNGTIFKTIALVGDFWVSSFWEYLGLGSAGVIIFIFVPRYRHDFLMMLRRDGKKILTINLSSETTTIIGNLLTNYALLLAPVALVYVVGTFQPVAVLLFTFLATTFWPKIAKEDFSWTVVFPKITAIIIMILGSALIFS